MRDSSHDDFIDRWVEFIKKNPDKWRKIHNEFIDSQFIMAEQFWKRLVKTKGGKEKLIEIYKIKNLEGYKGLLN